MGFGLGLGPRLRLRLLVRVSPDPDTNPNPTRWDHAGGIYVGGKLWHPTEDSDALRYNPGHQNP